MKNKKLLSIPVGLAEIFCFLSLVTLSPLNALGILVLAVVCTLGLSLIPILLIAYLFGYYTLNLFDESKEEGKKKDSKNKENIYDSEFQLKKLTTPDLEVVSVKLSAQEIAVTDYIKKNNKLGKEILTQNLLKSGWEAEFIENCFSLSNIK